MIVLLEKVEIVRVDGTKAPVI